ncbi:MAG: hypothetical protein AAGH68_08910 [Pseudomonadota bacterium]
MPRLWDWITDNPVIAALTGLTIIAVLVALFGTDITAGWIEAIWQSNQGD